MKTFLLSILFTLTSSVFIAQTTQEEYDYLTKGYPEAVEKGYSLKSGYKLEKHSTATSYNIVFEFFKFTDTKTGKTKAFLVEITKEKKGKDKKRYICIPIGNNDLVIDYVNEYNKLGVTMALGYQYAYAQFTGALLSSIDI